MRQGGKPNLSKHLNKQQLQFNTTTVEPQYLKTKGNKHD